MGKSSSGVGGKPFSTSDIAIYEATTASTAIYPGARERTIEGIVYLALGLTGEAGEVANKVKKIVRDYGDDAPYELIEAIADELGDVFWYLVRLCDELGYSPADVMSANAQKLLDRKRRGTIQGSGDNR